MLNKIILCGCVTVGFASSGIAQHEPSEVKLDHTIRYGKLDNGVSFYIKPVEEPGSPVNMRFYVTIGTHNQEPDETNYAHAIEHLAFRETKNFPEGLAYNPRLLQTVSMNYQDLMGSTGNKFTKYYFNAPPQNQKAIEVGLQWFKDIASGIIITRESVEKEKGVLLQEFGLGDYKKNLDKVESSLYSDLFPCQQDIKNFVDETRNISWIDLDNFYRKWYQPGAFVISVVGNIENIDDLENEIRNHFKDIPPPEKEGIKPQCEKIAANNTPQFSVKKYNSEIERGNGAIKIILFFRDSWNENDFKNADGIHYLILNELMSHILHQRLSSLSENYNPFHRSSSTSAHSNGLPNALRIVIDADKAREKEALMEVIQLLNQTKIFGVSKNELEKAKQQYVESRDMFVGQGLPYWEKEIEKIIKRQEILPAKKAESLKEWLQNLTLEEFNKRLQGVLSKSPEDIGVIIPENYQTALESEKSTRDFINSIFKKEVQPFVLKETSSKLINLNERTFELRRYREVDSKIPGAQTFVLENGLRIILRPTDTKEKKIYLHGFNTRGALCVSEKDKYSALYAPSIVKSSGIKDFDRFALQKFLNSTSSLNTGIVPYIEFNGSGIKGSADIQEFEDLLQLVYLYIAEPRKDSLAFTYWKKEYLKFASSHGDHRNFSVLKKIFFKNFSQFPIISEGIKAVDFEKAHELYKSYFQDAENFTFIITGNFKVSELFSQISKYLGNLPNSSNNRRCLKKDFQELLLNKGPQFKKVEPITGDSQSSHFAVSYVQPAKNYSNWKKELEVEVVAAVAQSIVRNLRAEGFSLYFYGVGGGLNYPMKRYEVNFHFALAPEEWTEIRHRTFQIIQKIKTGNLPEGIIQNALQAVHDDYGSQRRSDPNKILEAIYWYEKYDAPIVDPKEVEEYIRSLTAKDISEIAKDLFRDEYQYELLME